MRTLIAATLIACAGPACADSLAVDPQRIPEHPGHYDTRVELRLSSPLPVQGRLIEHVRIDEEWECVRGEHRLVRASYFTAAGRYAGSDPVREPWSSVAPGSALDARLRGVCTPAPGASAATLKALAPEYRARLSAWVDGD